MTSWATQVFIHFNATITFRIIYISIIIISSLINNKFSEFAKQTTLLIIILALVYYIQME